MIDWYLISREFFENWKLLKTSREFSLQKERKESHQNLNGI